MRYITHQSVKVLMVHGIKPRMFVSKYKFIYVFSFACLHIQHNSVLIVVGYFTILSLTLPFIYMERR